MSRQQAIPASGDTAEDAAALRERRPHSRQQSGEFSGEAARMLADELRHRISGEVRFDEGSRALYATDGSNYRQCDFDEDWRTNTVACSA